MVYKPDPDRRRVINNLVSMLDISSWRPLLAAWSSGTHTPMMEGKPCILDEAVTEDKRHPGELSDPRHMHVNIIPRLPS